MHDIGLTHESGWVSEPGAAGPHEAHTHNGAPPLSEADELELASRAVALAAEHELEGFVGDVFQSAGRAAGRFVRPETGRELIRLLRGTIGGALPSGAGTDSGLPGLAQQAASLLGLELEGLSPQDQEFEAGRGLVRFLGGAYQHAIGAPRYAPPHMVARHALVSSARRYAPGFLHAFRPRSHVSGYYGQGRGWYPERGWYGEGAAGWSGRDARWGRYRPEGGWSYRRYGFAGEPYEWPDTQGVPDAAAPFPYRWRHRHRWHPWYLDQTPAYAEPPWGAVPVDAPPAMADGSPAPDFASPTTTAATPADPAGALGTVDPSMASTGTAGPGTGAQDSALTPTAGGVAASAPQSGASVPTPYVATAPASSTTNGQGGVPATPVQQHELYGPFGDGGGDLNGLGWASSRNGSRRGRWVRRGDRLIVHGL
jgi:hypothetical protein